MEAPYVYNHYIHIRLRSMYHGLCSTEEKEVYRYQTAHINLPIY